MEVHFYPRNYGISYEIISDDNLTESKSTEGRCLACSICKKCMAGKEVIQQGYVTYCWKCFERLFGLKCTACLKLISGLSQMSFVYFNDQAWHKECFYCSGCGISLEREEFEQESRFSYCKKCNETRKFRLG